MYKLQKYLLYFYLVQILFCLSNCRLKNDAPDTKEDKAGIENRKETGNKNEDLTGVKHLYVTLFDTTLNNKHIQLVVDSDIESGLLLKVSGDFVDTTMMNIDYNTYYPSNNIFAFKDNYKKHRLSLKRTLLYKHYLYIAFDNIGMHRQMFIIDINKMRFLNYGIDTYLLGFIVDEDKIITCYEHPDPTYQYSRRPFEIYRVKNGRIRDWKKFDYNVPSEIVGNSDSMIAFMHRLLDYYKGRYK